MRLNAGPQADAKICQDCPEVEKAAPCRLDGGAGKYQQPGMQQHIRSPLVALLAAWIS